jgi:L-alanine-DL-glutamate epimerase-like enolase superfamily enzyme
MKAQIHDASVEFFARRFVTPLVLSTGPITEITEARAAVTVDVGGKRATGRGSIYLSDLWAWPDAKLDHAFRDAKLRRLTDEIAGDLRGFCGGEAHHPLELGLRLHENVCHAETPVATMLARAMCASPFDAAIHDATGVALKRPALDLYADDVPLPSADHYLKRGAARTIREALRSRRTVLDAWRIVGPGDPLDQTFNDVVARHGYRCFKLKIRGKDPREDVDRTIEVYQAVQSAGAADARLSVDSNEGNADAESVLEYLLRLRNADPQAFAALQYLEQPTSRDIRAHRHDWHKVSPLKPVLLDEGLTSLDLLPEAKADGWAGLALKTCKGHSFALVAAAWAREHGMLLSMQDLTNPGFSAIHSALLASRLDTINGVEINSPQFTPDANAEWLPRLAGLFEAHGGVHALPEKDPIGLGSTL